MIKAKVATSLVFIFLMGCSSTSSSERSSITNWAKQVAGLEKRLANELAQAEPLTSSSTSRPHTGTELDELTRHSDNVTSLYNEIIKIEPPPEAKAVHSLYVDTYAKSADYLRYYVMSIRLNDVRYFDKSVTAVEEANRTGEQARSALIDLLNRYSISCEEIDFCQ
jgi:hypothetical protein